MANRFFRLERETAQLEFNKSIAGCYRDGNAEYDSVGVLLLTWKEDDMNCKEQEVNALEQVLRDDFNYHTEQYEIPQTDSSQLLFTRLEAFIRCYDSPNKLAIIYYGGHAQRDPKAGDLQLFARRKPDNTSRNASRNNSWKVGSNLEDIPEDAWPESPTDSVSMSGSLHAGIREQPPPQGQSFISFMDICEKLKTAEVDALLILDSCYAARAFTEQPFGGRKCELFCSIADGQWARAAGMEGSFTQILTDTLQKMIKEHPEGFSTSALYRAIYHQQQPHNRTPYLFNQSKFDYGRIWLRPLQQTKSPSADANTTQSSSYSIDVRFQLTESFNLEDLNRLTKALQYLPHVLRIHFQYMHSPLHDMQKFMHTVRLANRLRPLLARIRRRRDLNQAQQLRRTDSTPPSPAAATSEQFLGHEPRNIDLFDWSGARFSPNQSLDSKPSHPDSRGQVGLAKGSEQFTLSDVALQAKLRKAKPSPKPSGAALQWLSNFWLSGQTRHRVIFFVLGVLAPTIARWAGRGCVSLLKFS